MKATRRRIPLRVYADTSVYGGVFDEEFLEDSKRFFDQVRAGDFTLFVSPVVTEELVDAPPKVRSHFRSILPLTRGSSVDAEVLALRDAYLSAGVVGAKSAGDALHVAVATVAGVDLLVSWNFKHIVHLDRIRAYNAINVLRGYRELEVRSPREVTPLEDEDL